MVLATMNSQVAIAAVVFSTIGGGVGANPAMGAPAVQSLNASSDDVFGPDSVKYDNEIEPQTAVSKPPHTASNSTSNFFEASPVATATGECNQFVTMDAGVYSTQCADSSPLTTKEQCNAAAVEISESGQMPTDLSNAAEQTKSSHPKGCSITTIAFNGGITSFYWNPNSPAWGPPPAEMFGGNGQLICCDKWSSSDSDSSDDKKPTDAEVALIVISVIVVFLILAFMCKTSWYEKFTEWLSSRRADGGMSYASFL